MPSGHLLINDELKPVLSTEEQRVVASKLHEVQQEEEARKLIEPEAEPVDENADRYFNYSHFPNEFGTI